MKPIIERTILYRHRFFGYHLLSGVVKLIDGILTILTAPLGCSCVLYSNWCEWNVRKDIERRRKVRNGSTGDHN